MITSDDDERKLGMMALGFRRDKGTHWTSPAVSRPDYLMILQMAS